MSGDGPAETGGPPDGGRKLRIQFERLPILTLRRQGHKETSGDSSWWNKVLEGMDKKSQAVIKQLRNAIKLRQQTPVWYYEGAKADVIPTFIAPPDSLHWWTDLAYDPTHRWYKPEAEALITAPFERLGVSVKKLTSPSDVQPGNNKQLLLIDKTQINLVGGKGEDPHFVPDSIDAIYTNRVSHGPSPDAMMHLKVGGLYVFVDDSPLDKYHPVTYPVMRTFEQLGFRKKLSIQNLNLSFPAAGQIDAITANKTVNIEVFEKSREFLPEERDLLRMNSIWVEVGEALRGFVIRLNAATWTDDVNQKFEQDLRQSLSRFFVLSNHPEGMDYQNINFFKKQMAGRFVTLFGGVPEWVRLDPMYKNFNTSNANATFNRFEQAVSIFQELNEASLDIPPAPTVADYVVINHDTSPPQSQFDHVDSIDITVKPEPEIKILSSQPENLEIEKSNSGQDLDELEKLDIQGSLAGDPSQAQIDFEVVKDVVKRKLGDLYVVRDGQGNILGFAATHAYEIIAAVVDQTLTSQQTKIQIAQILFGQMKQDVGHGLYIGNAFLTDADRHFLLTQGFRQEGFQFSY